MHIVLHGISYELKRTKDTNDNFKEYQVYKSDRQHGTITKCGNEIYYTARDLNNNILGTAATLKETLEILLYTSKYRGDKYIVTVGAWFEGETVKVEYEKNNIIRHVKRIVHFDKTAGDLYITLDNAKYFYYEFI